MNIYLVTATLFGASALLHFVIAKFIRKNAYKNTRQKIRNEAAAVVVDELSQFALFAGIVFGVCIALTWLCRVAGIAMSGYAFKGLVNYIEDFRRFIDPMDEAIGYSLLFVALSAFIIIVYRGVVARYSARSKIIRDGLIDQLLSGKLPPLAPTAEMNQVIEKISELESFLQEHSQPGSSYTDAQLKQIHEAGEALKHYYWNLDIERRINLQFEELHSNSWKESLLTFFSSEGFIDSLTTAGRWTGKAAFVIALLSLLSIQIRHVSGFSSETLSYEAQRKSLADARSQFNKQMEDGEPYTLTPEDESLLDELSRDFELALASNAFWEEQSPSVDTTFLIRSLAVREKILESFIALSVERHNSDSAGIYPSLADEAFHEGPEATWESSGSANGSGYNYRTVTVRYYLNQASGGKTPQTAIGREFREKLKKEVAQKSGKHWEQIKSKVTDYKHSFSKPASLKSVSGMLFADATGFAAERADINPLKMSATSKKLMMDIGTENVRVINDNVIYRYMNKLVSPTPYADAWNEINQMSSTELFPNDKTARLIKQEFPNLTGSEIGNMADNHPPGLKANTRPINHSKAISALDKMSTGTQVSHQPLSNFDSFFPAQNADYGSGSHASTTRPSYGEPISHNGGGGGYGSKTSVNRTSFKRARSYRALRGYSRIGGVLIGNMPANDISASIDDFSWTENADQMNLCFTTTDGEKVHFGPYPTAIVQQALAYAADGRPTTVTMVSVPPVYSLKILLHPALVNSRLGNDAINIDRFVDTYQSDVIESERKLVSYHNALYALAHWRRLKQAELSPNDQEIVNQYITKYSTVVDKIFPALRGHKLETDHSPLFSKTEFFDHDLVSILKQCLDKEPSSFYAFDIMLKSAIQQKYSLVSLEVHPEYAQAPCSYEVWSGVREAEYNLEVPLQLVPVNKSSVLNYPFDFIVQTAFITPTISEMQSENPEDYIDENPWQFPALQKDDLVNKVVHSAIISGTDQVKNEEIYTSMKQFTELQRLFRLAFEARLGTQFPLEKLVLLLSDTEGSVAREATPEWNPSYIDLLEGTDGHNELIEALGVFKED